MEIGAGDNGRPWEGESWSRDEVQSYSCHVVSDALSSHPISYSQDVERDAGQVAHSKMVDN